MIYSDWKTFWRDQNRILEIFFDFLIVEKGLSQNTIFSYKRDFKLLCMYLFDSNLCKKKLTSLRQLNHNILRDFFFN